MIHSSSSNNFVRHRICNPSPSPSGTKDKDNTTKTAIHHHLLPSSPPTSLLVNTSGNWGSRVNQNENDGCSNSNNSSNSSNNNIILALNNNSGRDGRNIPTKLLEVKVHGRRRSQRPPQWNRKATAVLIVALTLPSVCLLGMYMSSMSMDSMNNVTSSPHFRHENNFVPKTRFMDNEHLLRLHREEEEKEKDDMVFYEDKNRRRRYNDYEPSTNDHSRDDEEEEDQDGHSIINEDMNDIEYSEEEEQSVFASSHKKGGIRENNNQERQYQYPPRVLRLELQKQFATKKMARGDEAVIRNNDNNNRGGKPKLSHGDVLLSTVHRLPTYESRDIPPSERYITPYPDDDGYVDRLESVKKSKKYRNNEREALEDDVCTAKHAWQADAYPNCNLLHEYELGQLTGMFGRAMRRKLRKNDGDGDELVKYLASGYWRDVWLLSKASGSFGNGSSSSSTADDGNATFTDNATTLSSNETSSSILEREEITVLKTLRYKHEFTDRNYDRHRKDALASMRLSQSPNVVDIYAYCSNSAIFEYGKGGDVDAKLWPYDKEAGKYYVADIPSLEKIDIAYQVARAIADVHDVEDDGHASIAHTDITPSQFIFINGRWKLNDFNRCRFMRVRKLDGAPCGFYVGANPGKFRAPEEYAFSEENEMVDIYSMGNIFYAILSGNMPFEGQKESKAQKKVLDGIRPKIPDEVKQSDDIAIQTLVSITKKCWNKKPVDRPSAASIRDELKILMDRMMMSTNATPVGDN